MVDVTRFRRPGARLGPAGGRPAARGAGSARYWSGGDVIEAPSGSLHLLSTGEGVRFSVPVPSRLVRVIVPNAVLPAEIRHAAAAAVGPLAVAVIEDAVPGTTEHDLRGRIVEHIERRIGEPDLGPQSIASDFGVSLRWVHAVFNVGEEAETA